MVEHESANERRRDVRLQRVLLVTTAVLAALVIVKPSAADALAWAQDAVREPAVVSGVVYVDRNENGRRDASERGLGGVEVSDGTRIVQTDARGNYRVEIDSERRITDLVFVTQPSGYAVPVDEFMMPQFSRGLGELAAGDAVTADFALLPRPTTRSAAFIFGDVTDTHLNPEFGEQIAEISSTARDLAFTALTGDMTEHGEAQEFLEFRALVANSGVPVWSIIGNHEYTDSQRGKDYQYSVENYRRFVGPEWYSFDYGNRHFIGLDNNGQKHAAEQLEWLRRDLELAGDQQIVVMTHSPQNIRSGGPGDAATLELLKQYDVELFLTGHRHSNEVDDQFVPGARYIQTNSSSATIDQSPRGFRYIEMRGDVANPFRMYGYEKSLTITDPAPGSVVARDAFTQVQVNAYDTADRALAVSFRLDGGRWTRLEPTGAFTWFGELRGRTDLPAGEHTIDVRVVDEAGAVWTRSSTFELSDEPVQTPRAGADWSQLHGDGAHLGVAADEVNPEDLRLAWSFRTPDSYLTGSPVIADGIVYAGTRDDSEDGRASFDAVDLATGERLWHFPTPSSVHGTPAVANGLVYVPTLEGTLFALDARTGELRWQRNPETPGQRSFHGVAVADGRVYYALQADQGEAQDGLLQVFDATTGEPIWTAPLMGGMREVKGAPAVADGRVVIGSEDNSFVAFDAATGAELWTVPPGRGYQDANPTIAGGRVFLGVERELIARHAATGEELWTYRSRDQSFIPGNITPASAAVRGDTAYMAFPDGNVAALDVATGKPRWTVRLPGRTYLGGVLSSPTISGDTVYVGSNDGFVYGLDLSTGTIVWKYEVGAWVATSPAISGNTLVAGAWDGNLYAFTEQHD